MPKPSAKVLALTCVVTWPLSIYFWCRQTSNIACCTSNIVRCIATNLRWKSTRLTLLRPCRCTHLWDVRPLLVWICSVTYHFRDTIIEWHTVSVCTFCLTTLTRPRLHAPTCVGSDPCWFESPTCVGWGPCWFESLAWSCAASQSPPLGPARGGPWRARCTFRCGTFCEMLLPPAKIHTHQEAYTVCAVYSLLHDFLVSCSVSHPNSKTWFCKMISSLSAWSCGGR
jgi:hypothetical protein